MAKVTTLGGIDLPEPGQVDPEMVAESKTISDLVADGHVIGFTAVLELSNGRYRKYKVGRFAIEPMVGELMLSVHQLLAEAVSQEECDG